LYTFKHVTIKLFIVNVFPLLSKSKMAAESWPSKLCLQCRLDRKYFILRYFILDVQNLHFNFAVAGTHKETKQFFTLYNTLDDTKLYLGKEVSLRKFSIKPPTPLPPTQKKGLMNKRYLLP